VPATLLNNAGIIGAAVTAAQATGAAKSGQVSAGHAAGDTTGTADTRDRR